jgi:uncharacterized OB-fold protein
MVLYGIWLIDANSGLLLSHITVPGFNFNPELFSGFFTASQEFAKETSGGKLHTIALGNFKLLIRRDPIVMKVLAIGGTESEVRYEQFFQDIESRVHPILASVHRESTGFKAVTPSIRRNLRDILHAELDQFVTRKAPSDLSEFPFLREKPVKKLLEHLIGRRGVQLLPEPSTAGPAYSYPLAQSITGLSEQDTTDLLSRLAEYGVLLKEPIDTSLTCSNCGSLHLHPRIFCPTCGAPAQPVDLYEHLSCGYVGVLTKDKPLQCTNCGEEANGDEDFQFLRGYQCPGCGGSFKQPRMVFQCHQCRAKTEPEEAGVKVLYKFILNPALIDELSILYTGAPPVQSALGEAIEEPTPGVIGRIKSIFGSSSQTEEQEGIPPSPSPPEEDREETIDELIESAVDSPPSPTSETITEEVEVTEPEFGSPSEPPSKSEEELAFEQELQELEEALQAETITEAEYDRRFIQLRLKLRRLRAQNS